MWVILRHVIIKTSTLIAVCNTSCNSPIDPHLESHADAPLSSRRLKMYLSQDNDKLHGPLSDLEHAANNTPNLAFSGADKLLVYVTEVHIQRNWRLLTQKSIV